MALQHSITRLQDLEERWVEIIAFGISYLGTLKDVDYDKGTLRLEDEDDFVVLEIERVESFGLAARPG